MVCYLSIDGRAIPLNETDALFLLRMLRPTTVDEAKVVLAERALAESRTVKAAANRLGITPKTLWEWCKNEQI